MPTTKPLHRPMFSFGPNNGTGYEVATTFTGLRERTCSLRGTLNIVKMVLTEILRVHAWGVEAKFEKDGEHVAKSHPLDDVERRAPRVLVEEAAPQDRALSYAANHSLSV